MAKATVALGAEPEAGVDELGAREAELDAASGNGAGSGGEIIFDAGELSGLPVTLEAAPVTVGLRLTAPRDAKPGTTIDVDVVQRNAKRAVVGGVRVRLRIVKKD